MKWNVHTVHYHLFIIIEKLSTSLEFISLEKMRSAPDYFCSQKEGITFASYTVIDILKLCTPNKNYSTQPTSHAAV